MDDARPRTAVDDIAERHLDEVAALDPVSATFWGVAGHDDALPDFSPDWWQGLSDQRRRTLAALGAATAVDATDRVTVAALHADLVLREELRAAGEDEQRLNVIESPLQLARSALDLNAVDTADDWAVIARRMGAVPAALAGYTASLRLAAGRGQVAAARQVRACIQECDRNAGADGFFAGLAAAAAPTGGGELPATVRADLERAAAAAAAAYGDLAVVLRDDLLPHAPEADSVGRERYALHSRVHVGTVIDLDETYEWGQQELARIIAEMAATADRIVPGGSVADAIEQLERDPARKLTGPAALRTWMQQTSDDAVAALAGTHFDIPREIRTLECRIAPTHQGGIYYTAPSEDLTSRPGRMWWSVPAGVDSFGTWRERTTVYHEGVPGHHLQVAHTIYRRAALNRWRRIASWVSGHGEGWALYAERLMADLGHLDDPADYLGMLDGQSMRAARVVLDIGVHCGFPAPAEVGGGAWTYDKAWAFLCAHANMPEGMLRFELDRYLGWPGQAPSYKVGERLWLQLRDEVRARDGADFDIKAFHRRALDVGSLGMDVLRAAVLETA